MKLGWLMLVGCGAATPQPVSVSAAPKGLEFYVGHWGCAGTSYKEDGSVEKQWDALEVRVWPEYTNWLRLQVIDHGKVVTSELKGIDDKGAFHHVWTSDDGTYGSLTAKGWTGNQLVFDEDHPTGDATRMTFTKIDDTHYKHEASVNNKLEFVKTCRKLG
ncbi:MAG: hypothetical protein QM831_27655 [Kofleriaceae bacterium]